MGCWDKLSFLNMKRFEICLVAAGMASFYSLYGQNVLVNEEWGRTSIESEVLLNEFTKQVLILTPNTGYYRAVYNAEGAWRRPTMSSRISQNLIGGLLPTGIDGDSLIFRSEEPGSGVQWYSYNLATQLSRVRMKDFPSGAVGTENFGVIYRLPEDPHSYWQCFYTSDSLDQSEILPNDVQWQGYSNGRWLFVSQGATSDDSKTLNFYDSDGTLTPFPYPINRGKTIRKAHWINSDSLLVVEEDASELSVRLYSLVNKKLTKGDANRLKIGSYSLLYETWEDTIPVVELEPVDVLDDLVERLIPNDLAEKQIRKLGIGKFATRFNTFTDPNQAYGFLSRLVNMLPGSYAADVDSGIVILGPRRTTYDEVVADSALMARSAPDIAPARIIGFADQLRERNETVVSLYAMDRLTMAAVPFQLSFFNRTKDQMIFVDSVRTGQVSFVYGHGDELGLTITAKGYAPKSIRINSKTDSLPTLYHQDILMDALAPLVRGLDGELKPEKVSEAMDFQNILFDFDSSIPRKVSQPELRAMADLIKRSKASSVQIIGHTDDVGSEAYNNRLGKRRAESVCEALIRLGVNPNILEPVSKGESEPFVSNNTDFNRSLNRRVELGKH